MSLFSFTKKRTLPKYATIEKRVGETPLMAAERLRTILNIPATVPFAYAGRLDPMASGKLLILIGNECKVQEKYHAFDKEYVFEILLGVASDSGDVLGILSPESSVRSVKKQEVDTVCKNSVGDITLPYPLFSSRTVKGKPLHTWTLENRIHEITIPTKTSHIYSCVCTDIRTVHAADVLHTACAKIETIPPVTDERKVLGADFRRDTVRASWTQFGTRTIPSYQILTCVCIASSGTYMRSLAEVIARELGACGLAYSIHRTKIGTYVPIGKRFGFWRRWF